MIRVNGNDMPWHEGMTVSDILEALNDPYPYAAVRIDGRHIIMPDFSRITVPDGAEVFLMPLISGG